MRFINRGEPIKIRQRNLQGYYWLTLRTGETMELPKHVGRNNGLEEVTDLTDESKQVKVTEGQAGPKKVETKQFEKLEDVYTPDDLFFKELTKIKGIGPKMAKDIVVWGTKEKLIEAIQLGAELPFRDDVEEKLKREYGNE